MCHLSVFYQRHFIIDLKTRDIPLDNASLMAIHVYMRFMFSRVLFGLDFVLGNKLLFIIRRVIPSMCILTACKGTSYKVFTRFIPKYKYQTDFSEASVSLLTNTVVLK